MVAPNRQGLTPLLTLLLALCYACRATELLPLRFGPHDLVGDEPFPLLLQRQSHRVGYARRAQEELTVGSRAAEPLFQAAAARALKEAVGCYCPYTRSPAGAAIITASGQVFGGGYIESAAYNPSMSPLHTAFVDGVAQRGLDDLESQVVEVVLAERPGALVQHKAMAKALLKAVAPGAKLTVLPLQKLSAGASSSSSGSDAWAAAKTAAGAAGSSILYG